MRVFKGLCNNYLEGGIGKPEGGGNRGKSKLERGGLDVKFNTYRGGITFFTLFHKLEKW